MDGTLALWFDAIEAGAPAPALDLHVNLWRDLSADFNFLDVGFRLADPTNLRRFHLFFPVPVGLASISDLGATLRYGETLKAVFNDPVVAGSGNATCYSTEIDGAPHLTVQMLNVGRDLATEPLAMSPVDGTIVTFGDDLCSRMRATGGCSYVRIRIHLDGRARDLFSTEIAAGDWRLTTATSVTETTEFRFNERRSYPDAVARRIGDGVFAIGRIHYFLIRDLEQQLTGQHSPLRNVRRLEPALWTPYLQGEPIRTGTWRAPAKVMRRLAIYHWSTSFGSDDGPPSFTAFASFRSARVHLSIYALAIVLLGAMGSVLAALLSARLRTTVDLEEVRGDLAAGIVVAGLVLIYWLLVSAPWRRIAARTRAGLRRRRAALLSWLRPEAGD